MVISERLKQAAGVAPDTVLSYLTPQLLGPNEIMVRVRDDVRLEWTAEGVAPVTTLGSQVIGRESSSLYSFLTRRSKEEVVLPYMGWIRVGVEFGTRKDGGLVAVPPPGGAVIERQGWWGKTVLEKPRPAERVSTFRGSLVTSEQFRHSNEEKLSKAYWEKLLRPDLGRWVFWEGGLFAFTAVKEKPKEGNGKGDGTSRAESKFVLLTTEDFSRLRKKSSREGNLEGVVSSFIPFESASEEQQVFLAVPGLLSDFIKSANRRRISELLDYVQSNFPSINFWQTVGKGSAIRLVSKKELPLMVDKMLEHIIQGGVLGCTLTAGSKENTWQPKDVVFISKDSLEKIVPNGKKTAVGSEEFDTALIRGNKEERVALVHRAMPELVPIFELARRLVGTGSDLYRLQDGGMVRTWTDQREKQAVSSVFGRYYHLIGEDSRVLPSGWEQNGTSLDTSQIPHSEEISGSFWQGRKPEVLIPEGIVGSLIVYERRKDRLHLSSGEAVILKKVELGILADAVVREPRAGDTEEDELTMISFPLLVSGKDVRLSRLDFPAWRALAPSSIVLLREQIQDLDRMFFSVGGAVREGARNNSLVWPVFSRWGAKGLLGLRPLIKVPVNKMTVDLQVDYSAGGERLPTDDGGRKLYVTSGGKLDVVIENLDKLLSRFAKPSPTLRQVSEFIQAQAVGFGSIALSIPLGLGTRFTGEDVTSNPVVYQQLGEMRLQVINSFLRDRGLKAVSFVAGPEAMTPKEVEAVDASGALATLSATIARLSDRYGITREQLTQLTMALGAEHTTFIASGRDKGVVMFPDSEAGGVPQSSSASGESIRD